MKKRNLALCIVLSIVTFGIYGIYWFIQTNNINELASPAKPTSGGIALLLTLVTCGIYGFFWAYKMGGLLDAALTHRGLPAQNRGVIYLILQVLALGVICWILMQNTINSMLTD